MAIINGTTGTDTLQGGTGHDSLYGGGGGVDQFYGGAGNDSYYSEGNYAAFIYNSPGVDIAYGGSGQEHFYYSTIYSPVLDSETFIGGLGEDNLDISFVTDAGFWLDARPDAQGFGYGSYDLSFSGIETFRISTDSGNDWIFSGDGDDYVFTALGNDTIYGGGGIDTLRGSYGNDVIYGGDGDDSIDGDQGNDSYGDDRVYGGAGGDLIAGSGGNDALWGEDGDDALYGGAGQDTLHGGTGNDQMAGGTGDDFYVVDAAGDVVAEMAGEGRDTVQTGMSYVLGANIEGLVLTGSDNLDGTGNSLGNAITGNAGNNLLSGLAGNDTLNGGAGNDQMAGGAGDDLYVIDAAGDVATEAAGQGRDKVQSAISYTLGANIEDLVLTGAGNLNGTGNSLGNAITGNAGSNLLNGGAWVDTMAGGAGNDAYIVDNAGDRVDEALGSGTDTARASVSWAIAANVENLILTGTTSINGTGNALANRLTGNAGNNLLDGGAGADAMVGGAGNDTYIVDNSGDRIDEALGSGTDTVRVSVSYALGANVENLILTGTTSINGAGNALANTITGNAGNNTLSGFGGNDGLSAGAGNDLMNGGAGSDLLAGGSGSDRIIGGAGADRLSGDAGTDSFVFVALADSTAGVAGRDTITDFNIAQHDLIDLRGIDANTSLAGNQAFRFIGAAAFTGHAGELSIRSATNGTLITCDVNGDRVADLTILLDDRMALQADSFLL